MAKMNEFKHEDVNADDFGSEDWFLGIIKRIHHDQTVLQGLDQLNSRWFEDLTEEFNRDMFADDDQFNEQNANNSQVEDSSLPATTVVASSLPEDEMSDNPVLQGDNLKLENPDLLIPTSNSPAASSTCAADTKHDTCVAPMRNLYEREYDHQTVKSVLPESEIASGLVIEAQDGIEPTTNMIKPDEQGDKSPSLTQAYMQLVAKEKQLLLTKMTPCRNAETGSGQMSPANHMTPRDNVYKNTRKQSGELVRTPQMSVKKSRFCSFSERKPHQSNFKDSCDANTLLNRSQSSLEVCSPVVKRSSEFNPWLKRRSLTNKIIPEALMKDREPEHETNKLPERSVTSTSDAIASVPASHASDSISYLHSHNSDDIIHNKNILIASNCSSNNMHTVVNKHHTEQATSILENIPLQKENSATDVIDMQLHNPTVPSELEQPRSVGNEAAQLGVSTALSVCTTTVSPKFSGISHSRLRVNHVKYTSGSSMQLENTNPVLQCEKSHAVLVEEIVKGIDEANQLLGPWSPNGHKSAARSSRCDIQMSSYAGNFNSVKTGNKPTLVLTTPLKAKVTDQKYLKMPIVTSNSNCQHTHRDSKPYNSSISAKHFQTGFQTASCKPVCVTAKSLNFAEDLLCESKDDENRPSEVHSSTTRRMTSAYKAPGKQKLDATLFKTCTKSDQPDATKIPTGFSTASRKALSVSTGSLDFARHLMVNDQRLKHVPASTSYHNPTLSDNFCRIHDNQQKTFSSFDKISLANNNSTENPSPDFKPYNEMCDIETPKNKIQSVVNEHCVQPAPCHSVKCGDLLDHGASKTTATKLPTGFQTASKKPLCVAAKSLQFANSFLVDQTGENMPKSVEDRNPSTCRRSSAYKIPAKLVTSSVAKAVSKPSASSSVRMRTGFRTASNKLLSVSARSFDFVQQLLVDKHDKVLSDAAASCDRPVTLCIPEANDDVVVKSSVPKELSSNVEVNKLPSDLSCSEEIESCNRAALQMQTLPQSGRMMQTDNDTGNTVENAQASTPCFMEKRRADFQTAKPKAFPVVVKPLNNAKPGLVENVDHKIPGKSILVSGQAVIPAPKRSLAHEAPSKRRLSSESFPESTEQSSIRMQTGFQTASKKALSVKASSMSFARELFVSGAAPELNCEMSSSGEQVQSPNIRSARATCDIMKSMTSLGKVRTVCQKDVKMNTDDAQLQTGFKTASNRPLVMSANSWKFAEDLIAEPGKEPAVHSDLRTPKAGGKLSEADYTAYEKPTTNTDEEQDGHRMIEQDPTGGGVSSDHRPATPVPVDRIGAVASPAPRGFRTAVSRKPTPSADDVITAACDVTAADCRDVKTACETSGLAKAVLRELVATPVVGALNGKRKRPRGSSAYKPPRRKLPLQEVTSNVPKVARREFGERGKENWAPPAADGKKQLGVKCELFSQISVSDESLLKAVSIFENLS